MPYKVSEKYEIEFQNGHELDDDSGDFFFFIEAILHEIPRTDFSMSMKYSFESSTLMELKYQEFNSQEGAEQIYTTVFAKIFKWIETPSV